MPYLNQKSTGKLASGSYGENQLEPDGSGISENIGWIYWELLTPH